jgi:hypothetical protein
MKCVKCDNKKSIKSKNIKFDYSEKSGIPGCFITAKEYTCSKCSNVVTDLGELDDINKAIASVLCRAVMLTRPILKYVRIQFFNESTFQFGKRIKVNPTVYDEIENFKRPLDELTSERVKEQLELFYIKKSLGPITMVVGNKKTKLKID